MENIVFPGSLQRRRTGLNVCVLKGRSLQVLRWACKCSAQTHKPRQVAVLFSFGFPLVSSTWCQCSLQQDPQIPAGSPSHQGDAPYRPSGVASLKLVRYLQERVKKLRLENDTCSWSPSPGFKPTTVSSLLLIFFFTVFPPKKILFILHHQGKQLWLRW